MTLEVWWSQGGVAQGLFNHAVVVVANKTMLLMIQN
jgi:hypothetical protein